MNNTEVKNLFEAARDGDVQTMMNLISDCGGPGQRDDEGNTLLHIAARSHRPEAVVFLIDKGANVNAKNNRGLTPLHGLGHWEDIDVKIATLLIKYGADVNAQHDGSGVPLHSAVFQDNVDLVKLLLENGANPNLANDVGDTPLHRAVHLNHKVAIAKLLIEHGADVNIKSTKKGTMLVALVTGFNESKVELLNLLFEHGAKP